MLMRTLHITHHGSSMAYFNRSYDFPTKIFQRNWEWRNAPAFYLGSADTSLESTGVPSAVAGTLAKLLSGTLPLTLSELLNYQSETLCAKPAPHRINEMPDKYIKSLLFYSVPPSPERGTDWRLSLRACLCVHSHKLYRGLLKKKAHKNIATFPCNS